MEQFLKIHNANIFVRTIGKGKPLIFLHGGPGGNHEFFLPHLEGLARDYQLIFYDQMGCGKSERSKDDSYSIHSEVELLESLRKELRLSKVNLFGESWGSILALSYATTYPNAVEKVMLTAALGLTNDVLHKFQKQLMSRLTIFDKLKFVYFSVLNKISKTPSSLRVTNILDPYYVYSKDNVKKKKLLEFNDKVNQKIGEDIKRNYHLTTKVELLEGIPIKIAQGTHDILSPNHIKESMVPYLPNSELVEIKQAGHWTIIEQPEIMKQHIRSFF
ncbi:alpha/beta fold hydrolase [Salirhabdus sp. Marseille-P4669]|uniref:alpha/beta fold hydrolase n=1 Tax=Salirhabdus sp. Marseille-P4669 TaxID=2042310 RepID=UPI000C7CB146|nr:alpha/beta fold hydrolase [Salirhabdus sp. Marseille-P4669]